MRLPSVKKIIVISAITFLIVVAGVYRGVITLSYNGLKLFTQITTWVVLPIMIYLLVIRFLRFLYDKYRSRKIGMVYKIACIPSLIMRILFQYGFAFNVLFCGILSYVSICVAIPELILGGLVLSGIIEMSYPLLVYWGLVFMSTITLFGHHLVVKYTRRVMRLNTSEKLRNKNFHMLIPSVLSKQNIQIGLLILYSLSLIAWSVATITKVQDPILKPLLDAILQAFLTYLAIREVVLLWTHSSKCRHKTGRLYLISVLRILHNK